MRFVIFINACIFVVVVVVILEVKLNYKNNNKILYFN